MDRCGRCGTNPLQAMNVEDTMEVAGHTFSASLPAHRCVKCGDILIEAHDLRDFERAVVLALARAGERTPGVLKALRKAADISVTRFAELVDVPAATVSAWEDGAEPIPAQPAAVLRSLAVSKLGGPAQPMDALSLLRHPGQLARKVRLHLQRSLERLSAPKTATA